MLVAFETLGAVNSLPANSYPMLHEKGKCMYLVHSGFRV
jgi:hypothetical protein